MAKNQAFEDADNLSLPVISGVVSGDPVLIGAALPGVALTDRRTDGTASVQLNGAFHLEIVAAGAMAVGDIVYITAATSVLTGTAAGNVRFGYLLEAIAGASTVTRPVKVGY
jgi:predicted RecA/RadA family phage recombinase